MKNIYLKTTISAIIGTLIYSLIAYYLYPNYVTIPYIAVAFIVVWVLYYFIVRKKKNY
ncbi:MAG: hypothetical protein AABX84_00755 [Nanoarchaeota archaeon]